MGIINVLDSEISNKIAAGEVVERPSSVIKELVENSIDAGATNITVEIKNGGSVFMRVTDNGSGMSAEDAKICFLRHATSKIKTDADLDAIYTLGFRGEALSSIGAVAEVKLNTRQKGDTSGVCVTCRGGEIIAAEDAGTPEGTDITVENLFYNTPARRKFLKKDATEAGYITDIMTKFIFAYPSVSFRLIVNGKEKLYSAGDNSLKNAVYTVYGKDYAKHMLSVDYEQNGIKITGLIGAGNVSRPNRNYQSYFVNRRYIKSPIVIRAVEEAYKNQVMIGKFPVAVLDIELNAELIDINVHPTKLEVKFSNERDIYQIVYYAVKNALYKEANVPKIERETRDTKTEPIKHEQLYISDMAKNLPKSENRFERQAGTLKYNESSAAPKQERPDVKGITKRPETPEYNPRVNPFTDDKVNAYVPKLNDNVRHAAEPKKEWESLVSGDTKFEPQTEFSVNVEIGDAKVELQTNVENADVEPQENDGDTKAESVVEISDVKIENETEDTKHENVFIDEYFEIVGQVFDTYIIAQKGDEMMIIDQHAAHERLKYEELKADLENKQAFSQMLIEPVLVAMTGEEYAAFETAREALSDMGFDCDEFGDNTVMVRSAPGEVELGEVENLLLELVSEAAKSKKELITEKQQRLLYTIACKSAVKANMRMSRDEMTTLVRNVLRLSNINTCPHGRPIIITMSKKELEKEFGRIV